MKYYLEMKQATKTYHLDQMSVSILKRFSIGFKARELTCILGSSGCGKSTILRLLAGLTKPNSGQCYQKGALIEGPSPSRGLITQTGGLFPWMNCVEQIAFGLKNCRIVKKREIRNRARQILNTFGLSDFYNHYPNQLSGGLKQRLALARTLSLRPEILLLDEPFSALDQLSRQKLQVELRSLQREYHPTTVMVTHYIEEAAFLADRVVILKRDKTNGSLTIVSDLNLKETLPETRDSRFRTTRDYYSVVKQLQSLLS